MKPPRLLDDAVGQFRRDAVIDDDQKPDIFERIANFRGDMRQRSGLAAPVGPRSMTGNSSLDAERSMSSVIAALMFRRPPPASSRYRAP